MKQIFRLTEQDIKHMLKNVLNEMGTVRQNAFLKSLMGNRYDPKYDNYSVGDTGKLIQQELDRQKQRNQIPNLATSRQLDFIENNKYFPIPTIRQIDDKLTKDDAAILVTALNPYSNGTYTYYGHTRQRKEEWLPEMKDNVVPILDKYGLTQESDRIKTYVDNFMSKHQAKIDRAQQKQMQQKMQDFQNSPNTLFFISTKDNDNIQQHTTQRIGSNVWMDGKLQDKMNWDIAELATDLTKQSISEIEKKVDSMAYTCLPAIILGYDRPCYAVLWMGVDMMGTTTICGRIVDMDDHSKAYNLAKQLVFKRDNGQHI